MTIERNPLDLSLSPHSAWLRRYKSRVDPSPLPDTIPAFSDVKHEAITASDHSLAKMVWILEKVSRIQHAYLSAFQKIQEGLYTSAWMPLSGCESDILGLDKHFVEKNDEFGLEHIRVHVQQLLDLYPPRMGISLGYITNEFRCSICGTKRIPGKGCEHRIGEVYDGVLCGRHLIDLDIFHVAFVTNPSNDYSVVFPNGNHDYRFALIKFVVDALNTPWDRWNFRIETRRKHHPAFVDVVGSDPCPCQSSLRYESCCL